MAARIELDALQALPGTPYENVRPTLKCGDLFVAAGNYLSLPFIQKCTR
jgi:hypothetical protein